MGGLYGFNIQHDKIPKLTKLCREEVHLLFMKAHKYEKRLKTRCLASSYTVLSLLINGRTKPHLLYIVKGTQKSSL